MPTPKKPATTHKQRFDRSRRMVAEHHNAVWKALNNNLVVRTLNQLEEAGETWTRTHEMADRLGVADATASRMLTHLADLELARNRLAKAPNGSIASRFAITPSGRKWLRLRLPPRVVDAE